MNIDNDYDEDGNNIVPCPICMDTYCPSKENGKCPDEDEFVKSMKNPTLQSVEEELNKQHSLIVLCSEVIGALSYHNEKSAEEYRERLNALDEAKVIVSKICV